MRVASFLASLTLAAIAAVASGACTVKQPQVSTYFDVTIEPILQGSCVHSNTGAGCHVADAKGNAFGNLDLSGYAGIDHRRDLLLDYGPYQNPSLLVKNVAPYQLSLQTWDGTKVVVTTDIKHTGGPILDPTASGFVTLKRWVENGATVNNTGVPPVNIARQPASGFIPSAPGFDPDNDPTSPDFAIFQSAANPVLAQTCAAGNCHGTMTNALYLTRGITAQEIRWNYFATVDYLAATPPESEILRRPLATSQGGSYHEGGPLFASVNDPSYQALVQWATAHGPLKTAALDPAFMFFALKVQPILVKKGCMMAQCHSAAMFHDFRLRGGSAGSFSLTATRKNYAFAIAQMSLESDDVNASRLVRKNLYRSDQFPDSSGVFHRGGPLLEDFGDMHAVSAGPICDQANYDYQNGALDKIPAYCVIREWHRRERMERGMPRPLGDRLREPAAASRARPAAGLRRLRGRGELAHRRRHAHRDRRRDARRRHRRRPHDVRARERRRRPAAGRLVGRQDDRVRRPNDGERPARDLHDERRRDGLREAGGHRQPSRDERTACSSTTSTPRSALR